MDRPRDQADRAAARALTNLAVATDTVLVVTIEDTPMRSKKKS
jgi:hypothetical protein